MPDRWSVQYKRNSTVSKELILEKKPALPNFQPRLNPYDRGNGFMDVKSAPIPVQMLSFEFTIGNGKVYTFTMHPVRYFEVKQRIGDAALETVRRVDIVAGIDELHGVDRLAERREADGISLPADSNWDGVHELVFIHTIEFYDGITPEFHGQYICRGELKPLYHIPLLTL